MWVAGPQSDGEYQALAIHPSAPLLAATLRDGTVHVFDDEGTRLEDLSLKKDSVPTKVVWHPSKKYLAVAWNGGTVGLWCLDMESTLREGKIHQCRVTCLEWNPSGNRIISGDEDGGVVVWKVDVRGRISTMSQYRLKGQITCCAFRMANLQAQEQRQGPPWLKAQSERRLREKDSPPFFLAGQSGSIYYADDMGHCTESTVSPTSIHALFVAESLDTLLVVTEDLVLSRFSLAIDGKMTQDSSVKLSGGLKSLGINLLTAWIDHDKLAMTVNGSPVRIWDSTSEETEILDRQELGPASYRSFKFNPRLQLMAVGSDSGVVVLWQSTIASKPGAKTRIWEPIHKLELGGGGIVSLSWGVLESTLAVRKISGFQIVTQQKMCHAVLGVQAIAMQLSADKVAVDRHGAKQLVVEAKRKIKDLRVTPELLAVYTGKGIELHKLDELSQQTLQSSFVASQSGLFAVNSKFLFTAENNRLDIFTHQGLAKSTLLMSTGEGDIVQLLTVGNYLVLLTRDLSLSVFEVGGREPRLLTLRNLRSKLGSEPIAHFAVNACASMFAVTVVGSPSVLHVYCLDTDSLLEHTFEGATISSLLWDYDDSRLVVCELETEAGAKVQVTSVFATPESGILVKDTEARPEKCEQLIGVAIPYFVYLKRQRLQSDQSSGFVLVAGREYLGVENETPAVIRAISDFCFNLSAGNVDEAIKSVKLIRNESVWENMAKICAKLGRVNLAKLCLGKLKNAKALRTLYSRKSPDKDGATEQAFLATVHLGLYDEAYSICLNASRHDLLGEIYQCMGQWEKAIELAAAKDRPALPTVFFNFARHLNEIGDQSGAIAAFEKSNAARSHIPRMLMAQPDELRNYIDNSQDTSLKIWWAQNAESHGDYETALKYYSIAKDVLSIVRVNCLSGNMSEAVRIADENPTNAAVAFYIGRQLEEEGKIASAIAYYSKAGSFSSAIRLAKEHNVDKDLMHLALQSTPESMNDVARYFEKRGNLAKAVTLYSKTGNFAKALDICFRTKDTALLESIAATLDPQRDARALEKAAAFLVEQGATQKALQLLALAHRYAEVVNLCQTQQLQLTEDMIEKMDIDGHLPETDAKALHARIADICFAQGAYHLACKQYTLAGDRLRAMGSLLKSGDKDKIIFFANVSGPKHPEIYVIAANYMQSLDWRADTSVMKGIIQFYTKAKSFAALARFYESCALIEIDEFQNYEKAAGALSEAEKCYGKIAHPSPVEREQLETLRRKNHFVGLFIEAQRHAKSGGLSELEHICTGLLSEPDIDVSVRSGDIYGLLIETCYSAGQFDKARQLLAALRHRLSSNNIEYYVDRVIVHALSGESAHVEHDADAIEEDF